ncbi:MAG: metal-dependent hydrolase [Chloroflexota bacterium]
MQTYTHFIMTTIGNRLMKRNPPDEQGWPPLRSRALLLGSVMPDVPLTAIAITTILTDIIQGNFNNEEAVSWTQQLFETWFFQSPWVKIAHNLFHGPLMVLLYIAIGYWAWKNGRKWGASLFWFGCACLLHTLIDIPLHYDDGPLLLFPFNLDIRFYSPVSYWDPARYGRPFTIFEHTLVLIMLGWIWFDWRGNKAKTAAT